MTEYNIRLNPNCASAVHTGLKFKAGDKGITFRIAVDELDTTGTTAKIVFLRANGTSVESDIPGTNGVYTYKTLGNEFAVPGKTIADVKFYASGNRESTASFIFEVCGDTMDGLGAGAGGYSDRLEQLVKEAEEAKKEAENVSGELENLLIVYQNKFGEVGVLNPRGTYNSATTYEAFDLVYYSGVSWLCLQNCTGIAPAEGAYWQLFASADGGNAAKLGGKGASEYALGTDLANKLDKTGGEIENVNFPALIVSRGNSPYTTGIGFKNRYGILGYIGMYEANGSLQKLSVDGNTHYALLDSSNVAEYALSKAGGTIESGVNIPFILKHTGGVFCWLGFSNKNGANGYLGVNENHVPLFNDTAGSHVLLHDGNSAKVVQATSAPSDTTAVWVDTVNKAIKIYKDGAWTAMA